MRTFGMDRVSRFTFQPGGSPAGILWKHLGRLQAREPLVQLGLLPAIDGLRFFQVHAPETYRVARAELAKLVQVRGDDLGDLRIAADRLTVHAEHDALAVARHLDCPRADRLRNQLAAGE